MRVILAIAIMALMASCVARGGLVGVTDYHVSSNNIVPGFSARLWYPAAGGVEQIFGESRIRPGYYAVQDAKVSLRGKSPLVVLTHGSGGSAESMAWLATELAQRGAIAVAADHPASSGGDPERASMLNVWSQPKDVTLLLDQLLTSEWSSYIDHESIAIVGFSLGGASAISLVGGELQFEKFPKFCETNVDGACLAFQHLFDGLERDFFARANSNYLDPRVRAAAAIAPGFTESLSVDSLQNLSAPLLLIVGAKDQQLPPSTHIDPIRRYFPENSDIVTIEDAQHFSFLPVCRENAIQILSETDEEFVCQEFGGLTREEIHAKTIDKIVEFFLANGIRVSTKIF